MLALLWFASAFGADLADDLAGLPVSERLARLDALQAETVEVDQIAAYGAALLVVKQLDAHGRTDPSVLKLFLRAALSSDPTVRQAAVDNAAANGDPPEVAPEPAPSSVTPGPAPALLTEYAARRVHVGGLMTVSSSYVPVGDSGFMAPFVSTSHTWSAFEGAEALGALPFARLVGDHETVAKIRRRRAWSIPATFVTYGAFLGTFGAAYSLDSDDPAWHPLLATGFVSGLAGTVPLFFWTRSCRVRSMYDQVDAQDWAGRRNGELRDELGLTADDTLEIDLAR